MADDANLIPWDEPAFRLELTAAQLKVTHTALKIYFDDLGHKEADVQGVVLEVLSKLPSEHDIRAIDLGRELAKRRARRQAAAGPRLTAAARRSVRVGHHHALAVQVVRAIGVLEPGGPQLSALRSQPRAPRARDRDRDRRGGRVARRASTSPARTASRSSTSPRSATCSGSRARRSPSGSPSASRAPTSSTATCSARGGRPPARRPPGCRSSPASTTRSAGRARRTTTTPPPSRAGSGCFFGHGPESRAWAARVGVPGDRIVVGESAIEGLDARPQADMPLPRITFAGRLAADKGADVLVEAIGMLADPPPTYLLGDGELRAALEHQVASLGLQDVVRFSGWQAQPERFIAGATVHVVPSRREAWSQSAVLAMGLGVPVVAQRRRGPAGDARQPTAARSSPAEEPRALASAIGAVLVGPRRVRPRRRARLRAALHPAADRRAVRVGLSLAGGRQRGRPPGRLNPLAPARQASVHRPIGWVRARQVCFKLARIRSSSICAISRRTA